MPIDEHAKNFEEIKRVDEYGTEFWTAREILPLLGYSKWQNAVEVIKRAQRACMNSGEDIRNHFTDISKMVRVGSDAVRQVEDFKLDRYACYLIAQNGDPSKPEIALAQTYFAVQTYRQEELDKLSDGEKRLKIRGEVTEKNKLLASSARHAGVSNFGKFNDAGYRGLYAMPLAEVEKKKGIKKGELLDRAGASELAANWFRITQTEDKLRRDRVKGQTEAQRTHREVGNEVRETIKKLGGDMPEDLEPEEHLKDVKKKLSAGKHRSDLLPPKP